MRHWALWEGIGEVAVDPRIMLALLTFIIGGFGCAMVAMLAAHQRKMAAIIHSQRHAVEVTTLSAQLAELRREVSRLSEIVHEQALAVDAARKHSSSLSRPDDTSTRTH